MSETHEMRLHPTPYRMIKDGSKTVEMRLNDEKRQLIRVGDSIEFSLRPNFVERFRAEVVGIDHFKSFQEAYEAYPPSEYGAESNDEWDCMYKYYSPEDERRYGVLGIRVKALE